ncbi:inositol phosphate phosphatase SopB [Comamonas sp. NLF-1-9]|uniref:inositol phosphate phosphatase SopB n=1 Tax=Comamonas sp. NLF-1-9 TaxID=2853163 RepID=UPI001C475B4D|nr:inositol phosphate phosphatase SopB [Comamonas sp. NLF-1-9]QXL83612.1 hypothetical protein KUD94_10160 [Comamonas sp. NLF-1-9]
MPLESLGNRSQLQPADLMSDVDLDKGQPLGRSVVSGEGPLSAHQIALSLPQGVRGAVNGGIGGVRKLADLRLDGVPAQQIGKRRDATVGEINALINAIEADRTAHDGQLSPAGQALREHLDLLGDAYAQLSAGPAAGDMLMAQMDGLNALQDTLAALLENGFDALPEGVQDKVQVLCESLQAQVQDRVSYLGHTVADSPLSLSGMYQSKAQFSEGAVRVIDAQLQRRDLSGAQRQALNAARGDIFQARADFLRTQAQQQAGRLGDAAQVVGKKPLTGLKGWLFGGEQNRARQAHVNELLSSHRTAADTPRIDEQTIIEDTLKAVFKQAGLDPKSLGHAFHDAMNDVLNKDQDWAPIVKEIQLQSGSETVLSYSETTPAGNFISAYAGKGFNAHSSSEYTHAVNLARTRLADGQGQVLFDGLRHGVMSAFGITPGEIARMSDEELAPMVEKLLPKEQWLHENERNVRLLQTLSDTGLADYDAQQLQQHLGPLSLNETLAAVRADATLVDAMRRQANLNRARETVLATVLTDPALMQRALTGEKVPVDILSISLLTPDNVRPLIKGAHENERRMVQDQVQAWKDVSGAQSFEVLDEEGRPRQITLQVNPVACNYGVNAGGVGSASWLVGGWDNVAGLNGEALGKLLGEDVASIAQGGMPGGLVGFRMRELEQQVLDKRSELASAQRSGDDERADRLLEQLAPVELRLSQARDLAQQIAQIQQDGSYRVAGSEPYKMPTRLAVLADMFGLKVMFNCKSGKDRTGELDAEIKHFKLQMQLSGRVPHYERVRSPAEIAQFHEVVTHSGNFEMQRLNTGYAGYKLLGVDALYEQFGGRGGDDDLTANFLGLSKYTKS